MAKQKSVFQDRPSKRTENTMSMTKRSYSLENSEMESNTMSEFSLGFDITDPKKSQLLYYTNHRFIRNADV